MQRRQIYLEVVSCNEYVRCIEPLPIRRAIDGDAAKRRDCVVRVSEPKDLEIAVGLISRCGDQDVRVGKVDIHKALGWLPEDEEHRSEVSQLHCRADLTIHRAEDGSHVGCRAVEMRGSDCLTAQDLAVSRGGPTIATEAQACQGC
jgi:hypothetical protein